MKLLGFLLITFSSSMCGLCYASGKKERIDELDSFCLMLQMMQAELSSKLCPLPEISKNLASNIKGRAGDFLKLLDLNFTLLGEKAFYVIWSECLDMSSIALKEEEIESLRILGKTLGRYDVEFQISAIEETLSLLRAQLQKESQEFPQLRGLSMGVSVSMGTMLAILLI